MTAPVRVLIVEDQMLIAYEMKTLVNQLGHEVVGPFADAASAIKGLKDTPPDMGLLDINLGDDQTSAPVAEALDARGIPYVFVTGYGSPGQLPKGLENVERLAKPIEPAVLDEQITKFRAKRGKK